jgi:hypothetical protein
MDTFGHLMVTLFVIGWGVVAVAGIVKLAGILAGCHE